MQVHLDWTLAARLNDVASSQRRDFDDVLHDAILEYVKRWEGEKREDFEATVERIMKKHAWLLEQLGKGPE